MIEEFQQRMKVFQERMRDSGATLALLTDESSIAYLAGFWGDLGLDFGRPTFLIVRPDDSPIVLTPLMESEMVGAMTWVDEVLTWEDFGAKSWQKVLSGILGENPENIWVEPHLLPAVVRNYLDEQYTGIALNSISPIIGAMRVIKSEKEIQVMRQVGQIAQAMMGAAEKSLSVGVPEYESALALIAAGTRKAASFLSTEGWDAFISPLIHNLQIMQSGRDTSMVHRRASVKCYQKGDPVYFCFCNMVQFKQYKLGFDRMFFINEVSAQAAEVQEVAVAAQQAAIAAIRPGVFAEDVAAAANVVYREQGYETGYRTGRSIGVAYLEAPELKAGDKTVLRAGMTFAVDGGISIDGSLAGRIGDSVVVTENGCQYLTEYSRELLVV
ncbi:MAG: aminopeptidase P family protein [SAR324 cluster bacterium]|nr:aminopeptidase P family protein [SAR324 cluster bacterium]